MLNRAICHKPFTPRPRKANLYCGLPCYRVAQRRGDYNKGVRTEPCATCGKQTPGYRSKKRDGSTADHKFCGRPCYLKFHSRRVRWTCAGCGKSKLLTPAKAAAKKYCKQACKVAAFKPTHSKCKNCGVLFTGVKWIRRRRGIRMTAHGSAATCSPGCHNAWIRNNPERKRKISRAFTGDRHPNWRGGRSTVRRGYRGRGWQALAEKVRERDGRACTECGKTEAENGERLCVHHIIPFHNFDDASKANRMSNLRSLCRSCHTRVEWRVGEIQMAIPLKVAA